MLLNEKRASSIQELGQLLSKAGLPSSRQGKVMQALTPFAEVVLNSRH